MRQSSWLLFVLASAGASYLGCTERDDVARNGASPGDAGAGADTATSGSAGATGAAAGSGGSANQVEGGGDGRGVAGTSVAGKGEAGDGSNGACAKPSFAPVVSYPINANVAVSRGLATGDLNGDGKPDVVVSNEDHPASVLLNKGGGTFAEAFSIPTSSAGVSNSVDVVAFDANGDHKLDLAFANYPHGVAISLNQGDAKFAPPVDHMGADEVTSIVAGDLTGDGKPDLAVSYQPGGVGVLVNQGDGSFAEAIKYPAKGNGRSLAIANFDGQSGDDLVVSTANGPMGGPVSVLLNDGTGVFGPEQPFLSPGADYCYVTTADLGGDSKPDVAYSCGEIAVLINNGGPDEGRFTKVPVGTANPGGRLIAVDLLGRGRRDLVVPGPALWLFFNQGDDTFSPLVQYEYPQVAAGGGAVVSEDFDGDGRPDLAVITNAKDLAVLLNTCTP